MKKKRERKPLSRLTISRALKLADSVVSAGMLICALNLASNDHGLQSGPALLILYLCMGVSKLLQAVVLWHNDRVGKIKNLVYCGVFLLCAICLVVFPDSPLCGRLVIASFFAVILANRIHSIIRFRNLRMILINALAILLLLLVFLLIAVLPDPEYVLVCLIFQLSFLAAALCHIIRISFSQMRIDILRKIARKTFAVEILFGLMLLIVCFSFVFASYEEGIGNYANALWYCFTIVTTIGFGDFTASTSIGRMLSVILGIYGIVIVSLITSIIVNFYNEIKDKEETSEAGPEDRGDDPGAPRDRAEGSAQDKETDRGS